MEKKEIQSQESVIFDVCDQICGVLLNYGINYEDAINMTADIAKEIVDILIIKKEKMYIDSWTVVQESQDLKVLAF